MAEIAGLKLIVPSSVAGSGVSVSASGKVTFTAATSISVNGVFDSTYDNYLVVCRMTSSSTGDVRFRWRASGTDNSTASSYVHQRLAAYGTTVLGARYTENSARFSNMQNTQAGGVHHYVYGAYLAQPTAYRTVIVGDLDSASIFDHAGTHNQSTSYDGLTIYPASGDITGALTVYGLSQ